MRAIPRATGAVIALTMLMVSRTAAQASGPEQMAEQWKRHPDCIAAHVRDAPFSAEAETVWYPLATTGKAELRSTARYYRDRAGRVRVEYVGGESPHRVMVTAAAGSSEAYLLDTGARTITRTARGLIAMIVGGGCFEIYALPLSMSRLVGFGQARFDEEPAGERAIAGIQTTGTHFSVMLPLNVGIARGERWVSSELKLVVYSRREDSEAGIVEHRLSNISGADPPATLFEVPADYAVVRWGSGGSITWENAYGPMASRVWPSLDPR